MRRQLIIGALILVGAILIAYLLIASKSEPEKKVQDESAPLVQVAPVELRSGNLTIQGSGTVRARDEVNLAAEVAGKLVYVNPSLVEGQTIGRGAVLFRIDTTDYRNAVRSARADIAARQVDVMQAREEVSIAKAELEQFKNRSDDSKPSIFAGVDENDFAAKILPPESLQKEGGGEAKAGNETAKTNGLATREPQLRSARAGLQRAQAQLSNANTSLSRTTVRAPFTGIVRSKQIALGSYVAPGQALGSIVSSSSFEAVIPLSEREAALIPGLFRGGKRIEASVFFTYGDKKYRWQAFVDRANKILNPQTRTIDVFLRIPNPLRGGSPAALPGGGQDERALASNAPPLLVGSFVDTSITGAELGEFAAIPPTALRTGNTIWLVQNGKVKIQKIDILQRKDEEILIRSAGLGTNPMVITAGLSSVLNGQKVRTGSSKPKAAKPEKSKPKAAPEK